MGMFTLLAGMFALNLMMALNAGKEHRARMDAFERDLRAGMPLSMLVARHGVFLSPRLPTEPDAGDVARGLPMLRRAVGRQYQGVRDDPAVAEEPFPVVPAAVRQITWDGDRGGQAWGADSHLVFALGEPRMVYAVRVWYSVSPEEKGPVPPCSRLYWKRGDQEAFTRARSQAHCDEEPGAGERTATFWVMETIDQFRIHPSERPAAFRIADIMLLVPAASP
jgi:hypothetical protein